MADIANVMQLALDLGDRLEGAGFRYAIGGALAYGIWALPRATNDVDINVFIAPDQLVDVVPTLVAAGCVPDEASQSRAATEGLLVCWHGDTRVDVFTSSIPFSDEAAATRVRCRVHDRSAWFLSAEAIAVFKLLFFRPKDLLDLPALIGIQGTQLNRTYIRDRLVEMVGDDDERVQAWDRLTAPDRSTP